MFFFAQSPKKILKESKKIFYRRAHKLNAYERGLILGKMAQVEQALSQKNKPLAKQCAEELDDLMKKFLKRGFFQMTGEFVFAVAFALIFATIFRQVYFEPMEIPTGSMRPTFREEDRLIVSKMPFGINIPLIPKHAYFDDKLVNRGDIIVFTVENMDMDDPRTTYFGLFPGYKRLVKRCVAKPGDSIYYYGGKVYVLDSAGELHVEWADDRFLANIDHIPFIRFEGKVKPGSNDRELLIYQTNQLLGKITISSLGIAKGDILVNGQWIQDRPDLATKPHDHIVTYSDFWGLNNYAMTRLVKKEQLPPNVSPSDSAAYLELHHTPKLQGADILQTGARKLYPLLATETSFLPLKQEHLDKLKEALYTSRFVVKNHVATFYNYQGRGSTAYAPQLPGVPDGTYEFFNGKAYAIAWGGVTSELPPDHPLYPKTLDQLQTLFNFGIEFNTLFGPNQRGTGPYPSRFSYFNAGDLLVMGKPIFSAQDPLLQNFISQELDKQTRSSTPYIAFVDHPPQIDKQFMQAFGLKLPPKMYMGLGDNYSMSADSRDFGWIPQENLEGSPWVLLWPPGHRWGFPYQPNEGWFTTPKALLCVIALFFFALWWLYKRFKLSRLKADTAAH